jgi:hypothetical protein
MQLRRAREEDRKLTAGPKLSPRAGGESLTMLESLADVRDVKFQNTNSCVPHL